jgi:hypothetical protein
VFLLFRTCIGLALTTSIEPAVFDHKLHSVQAIKGDRRMVYQLYQATYQQMIDRRSLDLLRSLSSSAMIDNLPLTPTFSFPSIHGTPSLLPVKQPDLEEG